MNEFHAAEVFNWDTRDEALRRLQSCHNLKVHEEGTNLPVSSAPTSFATHAAVLLAF